jgi:hypothetical protein
MTWLVSGLEAEDASAFRTSLISKLQEIKGAPKVSLEEERCFYSLYSLKTV